MAAIKVLILLFLLFKNLLEQVFESSIVFLQNGVLCAISNSINSACYSKMTFTSLHHNHSDDNKMHLAFH